MDLNLINQARELIAPALSPGELARIDAIDRQHVPDDCDVSLGDLAMMIDHTLLRADATPGEVERLCEEAVAWKVGAVCVNSWLVPTAQAVLAGTPVKIASVVGFPLGACASRIKADETGWAVNHGADEIDMVINLGALKARNWRLVVDDIMAVRESAPPPGVLKVILEMVRLTHEEKILAALLSVAAGADFVKTSTGFDRGGANVEDVRLLRDAVGWNLGVKAAGGIHSRVDAINMVRAGANRIGASRTSDILSERS